MKSNREIKRIMAYLKEETKDMDSGVWQAITELCWWLTQEKK